VKNKAHEKILSWDRLASVLTQIRGQGEKIVFTNGCFDILHIGHTRYLAAARSLGDVLVVGVNSDASVRSLNKAPDRPLVGQEERAEILASLEAVDWVCIFSESTPARLLETVRPDVLVKGGDWAAENIVGGEEVLARGGKVMSLPLVPGRSTSALVEKIRESYRRPAGGRTGQDK
jgi:D-beta-D-heptose 7-phosphate kinase/D-beta-D-heptose 1-phosphate adenosyltransferase